MVTVQELEQQERQLTQAELEARQQASKPIPRRRFGTRVTPEDQRKVLEERRQAQGTIQQIQERRQQIQQAKEQLNTNQEQINSLQYLRKIASKYGDKPAQLRLLGLNKNEISTVKEIYEGNLNVQKRVEQLKAFQKEGLTPITNERGQIVGFLDEKRQQSIAVESIPSIASSSSEEYNRYSRAGIIKPEPTIREEFQSQSLQPEQRQRVIVSKEVMSYNEPRKDLETRARERLTSLREYGGVSAFGSGVALPFVETLAFGKRVLTQSPIKTGTQVKEGIVSVYQSIRTGELKQEVIQTFKTEPAYFFGRLTGEVGLFFTINKLSPTRKVPLASSGKPELYFKKNTPRNILPQIQSSELSTLAMKISEQNKLSQSLIEKNLKKEIILSELKKVVESKLKDEPSLKITALEGKPLINLAPAYDFDRLKELRYALDKGISQYKSMRQPLRVIDVKDKPVSISQDILKDISNKLDDVPASPKLFRIEELGLEPKISRKEFSRQFKEIELKEKKADTKFKMEEFIDFAKDELDKRAKQQIKVTTNEGLDIIYMGKFGMVKAEKELSNLLDKPFVKPYEDISSLEVGKSIILTQKDSAQIQLVQLKQEQTLKSESQMETILLNKKALKLESKFSYANIFILKNLSKVSYQEDSSLVYGSLSIYQKLMNKTAPQSNAFVYDYVKAQAMKYSFEYRNINYLKSLFKMNYKSSSKIKLPKEQLKDYDSLTSAYKTYYFTGGKKIYLEGLSTRQGAITKGQEKALKSLSARFGIEKTNALVKNVNVQTRYDKYFRDYQIKQGKLIKTPDMFIQKRGQRLATRTERRLIQSARNKRK